MPKRRIAKSSQDSSDDDSNEGPSQSQKTTAKRSHSTKREEIDRLVNDFVYFALVTDQKKVPFKRTDAMKHVAKDKSCNFNDILPLAKEKLKTVFGFDLVEVEKTKGTFFLINTIVSNPSSPHLEWTDKEQNKCGLLMIILSLIYFSGKTMQEAVLWQVLKKMGINPESPQPHEVFGDVKKLVTQEFRQQQYLEINKLPRASTEPPANEVLWGQRALQEVSEEKVQEFAKFITGENILPETGPVAGTSQSG